MINVKKVAIIMSVYKLDTSEEVRRSVKSMLKQSYCCDIFIYCDGLLPKDLDSIINKLSLLNNVR